MKSIIIFFLLLIPIFLKAQYWGWGNNNTSFYIDSINGNNLNSGKSPSKPWKNINKLNASMSQIKKGCSIFFKKDQTHYGCINFTKSGDVASRITISSYGSGQNPVISGMATITGWSNQGGNIWRASIDLGASLSVVLINDKPYPIGRYPNLEDQNGGYLAIRTHTGNQQIKSREIDSTKTWTGGYVIARTQWWYTEASLITSQSQGTLNTSTTNSVPYTNNWGFYITNNINTLDQQWEWYYDASNHYLYLYSNINPSSYTVEAAIKPSTLIASSISYLDIKGIDFKGTNGVNINIGGSDHINIKNCKILSSGTDAVYMNNSNYVTIVNCNIIDALNRGISASNISNVTISNNTISRINLYNTITTNIGTGIHISSSNASPNTLIQYNTIDSTAYNGIFFAMNGITIQYNTISNFLLKLADGGGIYCTGYGVSPAPSTYDRILRGNIISNGLGSLYGTTLTSTMTEGIYLDSYASYVKVLGNSISNCSSDGFKFSNVTNIIARDNTGYNNSNSQLRLEHNTGGYPELANIELKNNIWFAKSQSQLCLSISTLTPDIQNFSQSSKIDSNYYCRPLYDDCSISYGIVSPNTSRVVDIDYFKIRYGWDIHGRKSPFIISPYTDISNVGSNLITNGTFDANVTLGWSLTQYTGTMVRSWTTGLDAGTLGISYTSPFSGNNTGHSSLSQSLGSLTSGNIYRLTASIIGDTTGKAFPIIIRRNSGNYGTICSSSLPYYSISTTRKEMTAYYTVNSSETGFFDIQTYEENAGVKLDNITFYNINATFVDVDTKIIFYKNNTAMPITYNPGIGWYDLNNYTASNFYIPAYSSLILIKP
jgi:hypothetical protein